MNDLINSLQLSQEDLKFRRGSIGGSDANTIMSGDEARILRLWEEKTGRREPEDLSGILPVAMGSYTEALNAAWYQKKTDDIVTDAQKKAIARTYSFPAHATLDGLCRGGDSIFEAKHTGDYDFSVGGPKTIESLAEYYAPQLTHNMLCAGKTSAVLSAFFGNARWDYIVIDLDPFYVEAVVVANAKFWECVKSNSPPSEVVTAAPPKVEKMREVSMEGHNEWASLAVDWLENKEPAKKFEASKTKIKKLIEADVGLARGHGICVKRAKNGSLSIKEDK